MKQVHDSKTSDVENRGSSHLKTFGWFTRSYTTSWGWSSKGDSHLVFFQIGLQVKILESTEFSVIFV
jgi:hypothetical protein